MISTKQGSIFRHPDTAPKIEWPPLRLVRVSAGQLERSIESHVIEGVDVRITTVARTVVDCFKHRNKIGLDVAREALQEAWSAKRVDMDTLWQLAKKARVANVMRPYLEAVLHR